MKLIELTVKERKALAEKVGLNALYLWQIATHRRHPSARAALALSAADPRLDLKELLGG